MLTSTNAPPKIVPNEAQEEKFEEVRFAFFSATEPPPWENAPHPLHVAAECELPLYRAFA